MRLLLLALLLPLLACRGYELHHTWYGGEATIGLAIAGEELDGELTLTSLELPLEDALTIAQDDDCSGDGWALLLHAERREDFEMWYFNRNSMHRETDTIGVFVCAPMAALGGWPDDGFLKMNLWVEGFPIGEPLDLASDEAMHFGGGTLQASRYSVDGEWLAAFSTNIVVFGGQGEVHVESPSAGSLQVEECSSNCGPLAPFSVSWSFDPSTAWQEF